MVEVLNVRIENSKRLGCKSMYVLGYERFC